MSSRSRRAIGLSLGALVLAAAPAAAHPTIGASGPLVAGQPVRLEVALFGDEGSVTGFDLTFPVSFHLTATRGVQGDVGALAIAGQKVVSTDASIPYGTSAYLLVDGTPGADGAFHVGAVAHLKGEPDFHYPPVLVGAPDTTAASGSWIRGPWAALPVGAVAALVAGGLFLLRRRRVRRA